MDGSIGPARTRTPRAPSMSRRIEEAAVALRPYLPFVHALMALAFVVLIAAPIVCRQTRSRTRWERRRAF